MSDTPPKNDNENEEVSCQEMLALTLTDEDLQDLVLEGSDGVHVKANRCILAARSPVFHTLLFGKFREAKEGVVKLPYEGAVLAGLVEYILTDNTEILHAERAGCGENGEGLPDDVSKIQSLVFLAEASD